MTLLAVFWENPAVVGLILAIPASVLGYLGYRRSLGVDRAVEQAGIVSGQTASIAQAVDGLNQVISALQADNKVLREDIVALRAGVELCQARINVVEVGNTDLQAKNRELEREIVVLHMENEALRIENEKLTARLVELEKLNGPREP